MLEPNGAFRVFGLCRRDIQVCAAGAVTAIRRQCAHIGGYVEGDVVTTHRLLPLGGGISQVWTPSFACLSWHLVEAASFLTSIFRDLDLPG